MGLAKGAWRDSRDEVQSVAIVVRPGIWNVDDFGAGQLFFRRNLRWIDDRNGFDDVDHFSRSPEMRKGHIYVGGGSDLHGGFMHR